MTLNSCTIIIFQTSAFSLSFHLDFQCTSFILWLIFMVSRWVPVASRVDILLFTFDMKEAFHGIAGGKVGGYRRRVYKHVHRAVLQCLLFCPFEEELFRGEEHCWMGDLICFLCFLLAWTGQVALTHKVLDRLKGNPFADREDTLWDKEGNVLLTASSSAWLWL